VCSQSATGAEKGFRGEVVVEEAFVEPLVFFFLVAAAEVVAAVLIGLLSLFFSASFWAFALTGAGGAGGVWGGGAGAVAGE